MAELLLKHIEVLFQRDGNERRGTDIRISGNAIIEIGDNLASHAGCRVLDCTGKVALPGLVNSHHHFFQILTRCLPGAQNEGLFDWLVYHYEIWRHVRPESLRAAAELAIAELLLTGCTTTADHHYLFPKSVAEDLIGIEVEIARAMGIRFCGTRGAMTLGKSQGGLSPDDLVEADDRALADSEAAVRKYNDPSPQSMCRIHIAPCSPFNVTEHMLKESCILARKLGVKLHTHLAETKDEEEYCLHKHHRRPLEFLEDLGWLADDVWFAHGIHFTDDEIRKLSSAGAGISHCPSSNLRLGSGFARVPALLAAGVPVGLAVDGSASNDSSDMLGELRQALLLARGAWGGKSLTARQVISLATEGSARLLGWNGIGTIEVGKAADLALFDTDKLGYAGAQDLIAALLFCGFDHRAWAVIVSGEVVVEAGRLTRADEERIRLNAVREAKKLWDRAGIIGGNRL